VRAVCSHDRRAYRRELSTQSSAVGRQQAKVDAGIGGTLKAILRPSLSRKRQGQGAARAMGSRFRFARIALNIKAR
jgi:hypothetical protein